jgi:hypothetical protein
VDSVANSNAKTEKSINQNSSENSDSSIAIVESVSLPDPVQTSFIYQLGSNCDTVDSTTSVHADTNEIDDISNADEHEPGNLDSNDEHVEPVLETESVNSNMLDEDIDRCDDVQFNAFGDDALDEADIQDSADSQIVNLSDPIPVDASPFLDSALEINPSEMIDSQLDHPHLDTSESELESVSLTDSNFEVNAIDLNAPEIALSSERIATPVDETSNTASLVQSSAQTDSISTESAREVIVESRFVASIPNSTSKLEIKASVIKPAAFRPVSARLIAPTASLLAHRRPVEPEPVPVSKPCSLPKEFVPEIARARALPDLNPTPPDYRYSQLFSLLFSMLLLIVFFEKLENSDTFVRVWTIFFLILIQFLPCRLPSRPLPVVQRTISFNTDNIPKCIKWCPQPWQCCLNGLPSLFSQCLLIHCPLRRTPSQIRRLVTPPATKTIPIGRKARYRSRICTRGHCCGRGGSATSRITACCSTNESTIFQAHEN